ncbi:MAG: helix-turn-helix domain-containing protein [Streptosporangiales bacterium]|nr:helix-turn-helix domain-containing protein [Streptosporangiales bacterium]
MGSIGAVAVVMFPRALLPLRYRDTKRLAGVTFHGQEANAALVSSLVRQVTRHLEAYDGASGARVGGAVFDLITTTLADRLDRAHVVPPEMSRRTLLVRIYAFIEKRLGDPQLSPTVIAAAHHISTRYLHKLFESEGQTVSAWVRSRRLERCRRDLLDPALAARPVSAVARRWGLYDPGYFSRAFREAYGVPPAEYRRLCT